MKANYFKPILSAALVVAATLGNVSCINDLDISSIDPQSSSSFDQAGAFVKQYAMLGLTGQKGLAGSPDLDGQDEGESGFYRTVFNCNELSTDECIWVWQDNVDIPQFTGLSWNSSSQRTEWVYVRLGYDITQFNFFLDQTEGLTDAESLRQRAEVRFLRALHYWYFIDLFGKAPFKEHFSNDLPVEKGGKELYDYIQTELAEAEADMYEPGEAPFGRADKAANWLLRARLYLNAEVYTGTADYQNAKTYADKVINSGAYQLCNDYRLMFMADNDENEEAMKEIILPIRQDGMKTRNYGGSTYLVCGARTGGMPYMGTTNGWSCIVARNALVYKFFPNKDVPMIPEDVEVPAQADLPNDAAIDAWDAQYGVRTVDIVEAAGDDRAMFYSGAGGGKRTMDPSAINSFQSGLSIVKWQNIRSDGRSTSHTEYPDTDIPLFRLAEAYLTRAEANFRLNDTNAALQDILTLRSHRGCTTQPQANEIDEMYILDEWAREFYLEGRRRSDLVRFDCFTTDKYLWDWKGGVKEGKSVSDIYNVFPIPETDINNNPNMSQNEGY
ncbi:starch-binding outer membrane lipoprotein SusD [Phocaeicola salanitronis]|uniref:starch-binding outer membrane lipoprotein SusD n=1 Tax=Phocaeicola salanitronis TaxID=376805 RepID=UPI001C3B36E3|nr:starch-binding outer membrane lipoprotein SusD [Phocaeicola salanitronis]MDM8307325.1 starch-binding outer membrane lipoprotein SusD [Phocaeicola salanitronis]HJC98884.1 starch-binding outer membrane lipoprotein SusD [Candidatus Phocaeicola merdavium]